MADPSVTIDEEDYGDKESRKTTSQNQGATSQDQGADVGEDENAQDQGANECFDIEEEITEKLPTIGEEEELEAKQREMDERKKQQKAEYEEQLHQAHGDATPSCSRGDGWPVCGADGKSSPEH